MRSEGASCVLVVASIGTRLLGSFSERDLLTKVVGSLDPTTTPLSQVMLEEPSAVLASDPAAFVLHKMIVNQAQHVAVVEEQDAPVGLISMHHVLTLLAELHPKGLLNLTTEPITPSTRAGA